MNQINHIQVGDQTFQIGGTGSGNGAGGGSAVTRGEICHMDIFDGDARAAFGVIRPNKIYSVFDADLGIFTGIPQEMLNETGECAVLGGYIGAVINENSADIEGFPTKISASIVDGVALRNLTQNGPSSEMGIMKIFMNFIEQGSLGVKLCIYADSSLDNISEQTNYIMRICFMDDTILTQSGPMQDSDLTNMAQQLWRGKDLVIAADIDTGMPLVLTGTINESGSAYSDYPFWGEQDGLKFYSKSKELGSDCFVEYDGGSQLSCVLLYVGPSYMEVNSVPHYMLNIHLSSPDNDSSFITNIPCMWNNATPPTFGASNLVQMSILDGIGSYNTVDLQPIIQGL